jgi:hypothetical protein
VKAWNRHALSASFTSHKRIDLFEAILTELKIAGPKDARQVDCETLTGRQQLFALKTRTGDPGS